MTQIHLPATTEGEEHMQRKVTHPRRFPHLRLPSAGLIVALAAVVVAGCGSSSSSSSSSGSSSNKKTAHIGFIYATTASNFAQEMALGAQAAASHTPGVEFSQSAPNTAEESQEVPLFLAAIHTDTDGIAMETLAPNLFVRPVKQAEEANIPQVAVDTPPPEGTHVSFFVGNSNTELGETLAKALLAKIPSGAKGEILVGTDSPSLIVLQLRNKGFEKVIKQERPGITFNSFDSKQGPTENYDTWNSQVKAHPSAIAYVGPGSQDAVSMAQIERQTGKHYLVGADDLDPVALQGVKQGYVDTLVSPEHWLKGYIAVKVLAEHALDGKAIPNGWWNPGSIVVNSKNVDKILARQKTAASRYAYFAPIAQAQLANPSKYLKPLSAAN
jgi:ABC-type sugar transport system substrate-binding protein